MTIIKLLSSKSIAMEIRMRIAYVCMMYGPVRMPVYRVHTEKRQYTSILHGTWYIVETNIYHDTIKWVVLCLITCTLYFITCTRFQTSSITMFSNQSQYSSDMIEQWSCIVASLKQVQARCRKDVHVCFA